MFLLTAINCQSNKRRAKSNHRGDFEVLPGALPASYRQSPIMLAVLEVRARDSRRIVKNLSGLSDEQSFMETEDRKEKDERISRSRAEKKARKTYRNGRRKDRCGTHHRLLDYDHHVEQSYSIL